jgi:Protein of unknown function (DUF4233)
VSDTPAARSAPPSSAPPPEPAPAPAPNGLYAVGTGLLALEAIVMLLAGPAVLSLERGNISALRVGYLFGLAVLLIVAAARLRKPGGKVIASVLQLFVIASGVVTWPMYVVGLAFTGIWVYWLRLWPRP